MFWRVSLPIMRSREAYISSAETESVNSSPFWQHLSIWRSNLGSALNLRSYKMFTMFSPPVMCPWGPCVSLQKLELGDNSPFRRKIFKSIRNSKSQYNLGLDPWVKWWNIPAWLVGAIPKFWNLRKIWGLYLNEWLRLCLRIFVYKGPKMKLGSWGTADRAQPNDLIFTSSYSSFAAHLRRHKHVYEHRAFHVN